jgi:hypothetical protein
MDMPWEVLREKQWGLSPMVTSQQMLSGQWIQPSKPPRNEVLEQIRDEFGKM